MSSCVFYFTFYSVVVELGRKTDYFYGAQVDSTQFSCGLCWEETRDIIRSHHCMRKTEVETFLFCFFGG